MVNIDLTPIKMIIHIQQRLMLNLPINYIDLPKFLCSNFNTASLESISPDSSAATSTLHPPRF